VILGEKCYPLGGKGEEALRVKRIADGETCILLSASQEAMVDLELFFYTKDSMLRMDQESKEDPSQSYEELARRHAERIESFSFVLQES